MDREQLKKEILKGVRTDIANSLNPNKGQFEANDIKEEDLKQNKDQEIAQLRNEINQVICEFLEYYLTLVVCEARSARYDT